MHTLRSVKKHFLLHYLLL